MKKKWRKKEMNVRNPLVKDGDYQVVVTVNTKHELVLQWYDEQKEHHKNATVYTTVKDVLTALERAAAKTGYALNKYTVYTQQGYKPGDKGMVLSMRNAWKRPQLYWHQPVETKKTARHVWQTF